MYADKYFYLQNEEGLNGKDKAICCRNIPFR